MGSAPVSGATVGVSPTVGWNGVSGETPETAGGTPALPISRNEASGWVADRRAATAALSARIRRGLTLRPGQGSLGRLAGRLETQCFLQLGDGLLPIVFGEEEIAQIQVSLPIPGVLPDRLLETIFARLRAITMPRRWRWTR